MAEPADHWVPSLVRQGGVPVRGIIHVGAHIGQEHNDYLSSGVRRQIWIEPVPEYFDDLKIRLKDVPEARAFRVACGDHEGETVFHKVEGYHGQCGSILRMKRLSELHPSLHPREEIKVPVVLLDDLLDREGINRDEYNLLVCDVQGYELHVLRGARRLLKKVDYAIIEVAKTELYEGCALKDDIDRELLRYGLRCFDCAWRGPRPDLLEEADAFYARFV